MILKKKNPYHRGIYLANVTNDFFFFDVTLHRRQWCGAVRCEAIQKKKKKNFGIRNKNKSLKIVIILHLNIIVYLHFSNKKSIFYIILCWALILILQQLIGHLLSDLILFDNQNVANLDY